MMDKLTDAELKELCRDLRDTDGWVCARVAADYLEHLTAELSEAARAAYEWHVIAEDEREREQLAQEACRSAVNSALAAEAERDAALARAEADAARLDFLLANIADSDLYDALYPHYRRLSRAGYREAIDDAIAGQCQESDHG